MSIHVNMPYSSQAFLKRNLNKSTKSTENFVCPSLAIDKIVVAT